MLTEPTQHEQEAPKGPSALDDDEGNFEKTMAAIEAKLARLQAGLSRHEDGHVEKEDLRRLERQIRKLSQRLEQRFSDEEAVLGAKGLPPEIL